MLVHEREDLVRAGHRVRGARGQRRTGPVGDVPRLDLVAEGVDRLRGRADPDQARVENGLGEPGVLGEEPVTRVDGVRPRLLRDVQQLLND